MALSGLKGLNLPLVSLECKMILIYKPNIGLIVNQQHSSLNQYNYNLQKRFLKLIACTYVLGFPKFNTVCFIYMYISK